MRDFTGGSIVKLPVAFLHEGNPLIPEVGTVTYSVYDHTGAVIDGLEDVALVTTVATFRITVEIPAAANVIASGKRFERRTVVVSYEYQGVSDTLRLQYRLVPVLNHSVSPQQVRSFLGVADHELLDADIDLTVAYLTAEVRIGQDELEAALVSGTTDEIAANDVIRMYAALAVIPSLKQRLAQEERNGVKMFARANIKDFDGLRKEALARIDTALEGLIAEAAISMTLVVTTQDIDPITAGG